MTGPWLGKPGEQYWGVSTGGIQREDRVLRRIRIAGLVLLGIQLLAMVAWSTVLWSHFVLRMDYAQYHGAWWLIGHGDLNPTNIGPTGGYGFWQNDFELMMWPLGLLALVAPHGPVLGILQDVAVAVAEAVVFLWMWELVENHAAGRIRIVAVSVGLALLLANPWTWQSVSFDFHMEPVGLAFIVLAARLLTKGKRIGWLFVLLAAMCGDATAAWLVGLGIGMVISAPRSWRRGFGVAAAGAGYLVLSAALHGDMGGNPAHLYGYLAGAGVVAPTLGDVVKHLLAHPRVAISTLWAHRVDIYANVAPAGLVGLANPLALGLWLVTLPIVDLASGSNFAQPLYQEIALYVLIPLGSVCVLIAILRRFPPIGLAFGVILVANAVTWSAVWAPIIYRRWLDVPAPTAAVLRSLQVRIPPTAEVAASHGVVGRFSDRRFDYQISAAGEPVPIGSHDTYWIVVPQVGAETEPSSAALAVIAELADHWHAQLILHRGGVWAFHWEVPRSIHSVETPAEPGSLPGWTSPGPAGRPDLTGQPARWTTEGTGSAGDVISGDRFNVPPGTYRAGVTLSASVPVEVEVWNDSLAAPLALRRIGPTHGCRTIRMTVTADRIPRKGSFEGWGPFVVAVPGGIAGDALEIRVRSPGSGEVRVGELSLRRVTTGSATGNRGVAA